MLNYNLCTRKRSETHCFSNTKVKERNSHLYIGWNLYPCLVLPFFLLSFYFSSNSQHHRESLGKKSVALMTCYSPLAWVYNGHLRADLPSQLGVGGEKMNCLWCTLMTLHHNTVFIFTYYQKLVCFVQSPAANLFCLTSTRLPDHLHHPCPTFLTFILNNF